MKFRRGSSLVFAAVMIAASAGLVSLGGSAANAGAASAKKSPYIVGTMYPLTGAGLNEPVWLAGAVAAAAGVNRRGGINGHPIKLVQCDDTNTANKATACAREFVSDHAIAIAGGVTLFGDLVTPILQRAGIPVIGYLPIEPIEYNSPTEFPLDTSGEGTVGGGLAALHASGAKSVFIVAAAGGAASTAALNFATADATAVGLTVSGSVLIPLTATSYSTYAEQAIASNADSVFSYLGPSSLTLFLQAAEQLNATFKLGTDGESTPADYALEGSLATNAVYASSYPPVGGSTKLFPALKYFNADMNALEATDNQNAAVNQRTSFSERAWLAVEVTAQIAKTLKTVSAHTMDVALKSDKNIVTGMIPPWTPSLKGPPNYTRLSNGNMYLIQRSASGEKLIQPKPVNILKILFPTWKG
jgi:ABC-type branched-subunit amino acid transport system substrate-binding protein